MKVVISILVLIGALVGVWKLWEYWEKVNKEKLQTTQKASDFIDSRSLPGMPAPLEPTLQEAQNRGPESFGQWLEKNRPIIQDPRLAAVELDYIVVITRSNPVEAKRLFANVKSRIAESSPLYKRIRAMEDTYD